MCENQNIKISIIIPVFNAEKYLPQCIESIKKQSYSNYEVILINDGSEDHSEEICLRYADEDNRVRYFKQENSGVSKTRNRGIWLARGKYIIFVDNDDYLNKDFLYKIWDHFEDNADIIIFEYRNVLKKEDIEKLLEKNYGKSNARVLIGYSEYFQKELLCPTDHELKNMAIVFPWGKAYRKDFLIKNGLFFDHRVKLCEDVYLNLQVYDKAQKIVLVDYPAYFYFRNLQSAGKRYNPNIVKIEINNIKLLNELVCSKYRKKEYYKAYDNCLCFRYWSCCFSYFVHPDNDIELKQIISEMKIFERDTNMRRAFKTLPYIRKSMGKKEWIFLMAIKYHLYWPILELARWKMRQSRKRNVK